MEGFPFTGDASFQDRDKAPAFDVCPHGEGRELGKANPTQRKVMWGRDGQIAGRRGGIFSVSSKAITIASELAKPLDISQSRLSGQRANSSRDPILDQL